MEPSFLVFQHTFLFKTTLIQVFVPKIQCCFHYPASPWLCVQQCNCTEVYYLLLDLNAFFIDLLRHINSSRIYKHFKSPVALAALQSLPQTFGRKWPQSKKFLFLHRTQANVSLLSLCSKDMELWIISFFVQSQYFSNVSIPYKERLSGTCNIVFHL